MSYQPKDIYAAMGPQDVAEFKRDLMKQHQGFKYQGDWWVLRTDLGPNERASKRVHFVKKGEHPETVCGRGLYADSEIRNGDVSLRCPECNNALRRGVA